MIRSILLLLVVYGFGGDLLAQAEWGAWAGTRLATIDLKGEGSGGQTANSPALGGVLGVWFQSRPSPRGRISMRTGLGFNAMHVSFRDSILRDKWTKTTDVRCIELPIMARYGVSQRVQGILGLRFAVPVYYADVVEGVRSGFQFPNTYIVNQQYRIALRNTYMVSRLIANLNYGVSCRIGKRIGVEFLAEIPIVKTEKYVYDGASFEYAGQYSSTRSLYTHYGLSCTYTFSKAKEGAPVGEPSAP